MANARQTAPGGRVIRAAATGIVTMGRLGQASALAILRGLDQCANFDALGQ